MKLKCTHVAEGEEDWFTAGKTYDVRPADLLKDLYTLTDDVHYCWRLSTNRVEELPSWVESKFEEVVE